MQTLGVIKQHREIEIENGERRGGLVSCSNIEGIKNEAAVTFFLVSKLCFFHSTLLDKFISALLSSTNSCLFFSAVKLYHSLLSLPPLNEGNANINCKPMNSGVTQTQSKRLEEW